MDDACVFTRLLGQECRSGDDFGLDARCNFSEGKETCVLRDSLPLGQTCSSGSVCGPGLFFNFDSRACAVTPSYEVVGEGESCRTNYVPSADYTFCGPGLACTSLEIDVPQDTVGTCTRPSRDGPPCSFTSECSPGLYCTGFASDIGECAPAMAPGLACVFGVECDSGACDAGLCVGESSCR